MSGIALAVVAWLAAGPALADPTLEGRFQGRGEGELTLQVLAVDLGDPEAGYFVVAETAARDACSGDLRGIARHVNDTTLRLTRKPADSEEACDLTLRFSPDRNRVQMTSKSCAYYRGASCDFVGSLRRR